ncbi:MAG: 50S ribosomal protein L4 [bacterium]|jgi:large subunit ribosomal protein L4|nr:50S ribosomal protein L4 [Bacillota bacterium]HHW54484.1 50S ribosomal protein L4 [Bacillota bacterium]
MPKVAVYNIEGQQVGEIELADTVFGAEVNEAAIKQVVDMQLANRRRGTASTKGRGEVRGGGRKPWRQKGTGRARHGSRRSPIWRGGAVIFGPKPRDYSFTVPKKLKRTALRSALSAKVAAGELTVLEGLEFDTPRTKRMVEILRNLQISGKALIVTGLPDLKVAKSARNIPGVKSLPVNNLNVYDLLLHERLVLTKDAVAKVEEVLG